MGLEDLTRHQLASLLKKQVWGLRERLGGAKLWDCRLNPQPDPGVGGGAKVPVTHKSQGCMEAVPGGMSPTVGKDRALASHWSPSMSPEALPCCDSGLSLVV